jgi:hypothetical protein
LPAGKHGETRIANVIQLFISTSIPTKSPSEGEKKRGEVGRGLFIGKRKKG